MEEETLPKYHPKHPWMARLIVGLAMLLLSFIGLIVTDLFQQGSFDYWRVMVPLFAVMSIGLSSYLRRKKHLITFVKIWQEILHWLGLIVAVYLFSVFVQMGIIGRFQAALGTIILLALTTYLAGIYLDVGFVIIGIVLGIFAAGAALMAEYLYTIMLPLTLIVALVIIYIAHKKYRKMSNSSEHSED